jgi:hypothetical protein
MPPHGATCGPLLKVPEKGDVPGCYAGSFGSSSAARSPASSVRPLLGLARVFAQRSSVARRSRARLPARPACRPSRSSRHASSASIEAMESASSRTSEGRSGRPSPPCRTVSGLLDLDLCAGLEMHAQARLKPGTGLPGRSRRQVVDPYLISTSAPASSSWALIESASSRATPSLTGFGAPSTRSLASLRPRPVIARTTLIAWIFC